MCLKHAHNSLALWKSTLKVFNDIITPGICVFSEEDSNLPCIWDSIANVVEAFIFSSVPVSPRQIQVNEPHDIALLSMFSALVVANSYTLAFNLCLL